MQHQLIEVNKLDKSPQNARRTVAKGAAEDLKASILAHGLLHNLVVTDGDDGIYRVIDGGRRLEALKALQAEGKLPADYAVPCQVRERARTPWRRAWPPTPSGWRCTRRTSSRPSPGWPRPATRRSRSPNASARPRRYVEQRLRLGNADPKLLKEYRAENLTLDCLMAFAITDDRKRQMKVYRSLKDSQSLNPRAIRAALTDTMAEADSKLAKFVGLDAYREAGGTTQSDLFSDAVYLENPELLNDLAIAKLDAIRQELEAEGWGWIDVSPERDWEVIHRCGRIHPQPVDVPAGAGSSSGKRDRSGAGRDRAKPLEDTESRCVDRRSRKRRKPGWPRSRKRSTPWPPTIPITSRSPAATCRSTMTARFASRKGWSASRT